MKNGQWRIIGLLLALLGTVSCGGDGDGNGNGDGGGAGTTVAGTGMGTITGFGSLILNDDRVFRVEAETEISLDDSPITETELRQEGLGLVTRVEVGEDVNDDFSAGTAKRVHAENALTDPQTHTGLIPECVRQTTSGHGDSLGVLSPRPIVLKATSKMGINSQKPDASPFGCV